MTNNTLQLVCEKVFLGRHRCKQMVNYPGLLDSRLAGAGLRRAAEECANPGADPGQHRTAAGPAQAAELERQLRLELAEAERAA